MYINNIIFSTAGLVLVEWDTGDRFTYNYGINDLYDVVICDEPRISLDGLVAVGCFVKRGKSFVRTIQ
jgi:hypothetical protein